MLRPIVSITLRSGITFRQFADLLRLAYVEVALKEYGIDGRPTNISRVAMLTGLTRRDASRQRDLLASEEEVLGDRVHSAARVLMGWHTDDTFIDENGEPLELAPEGDISFNELYKRHSGADIPLTTMLKELLSVGAVERTEDGRLRALTRYFRPAATDPHAIERAGHVLADLGTTVRHNIYRDQEKDKTRFEGRAWSAMVPAAQAPAFRAFLEDRAQQFLEEVDAWLIAHEDHSAPEQRVRIGAGAYEIRTPVEARPQEAAGDQEQQQ